MRTGSGRSAGDDVVGRRLLLLGGGLGALSAPLAVDAPAAEAASGDPVLLGRDNRATSVTTVRNVQDDGVGLRVRVRGGASVGLQAESPNIGVSGQSEQGTGVLGESVFGDGVSGHSLFGPALRGNSDRGFGVDGGSSESTGVSGSSRFGSGVVGANLATDKCAVLGSAQNGSTGVQGLSGAVTAESPVSPPSTGVHGRCDEAVGTGVLAESAHGTALKVDGTAVFSRSGVLTVPAGARSPRQDDVELTSESLVLAVLRRHQAFRHVVAAVPHPASRSFTVHLNLPASPGCEVAWFVVN